MPWTETTRPQYRRDDLRYASDLRDKDLALYACRTSAWKASHS